jgi:hypothetical protein
LDQLQLPQAAVVAGRVPLLMVYQVAQAAAHGTRAVLAQVHQDKAAMVV